MDNSPPVDNSTTKPVDKLTQQELWAGYPHVGLVLKGLEFPITDEMVREGLGEACYTLYTWLKQELHSHNTAHRRG